MDVALGKKASALVPVVMSLMALLLVGIQLAIHGMQPERDEGAIAHLYQLLVVAQLPVIGFFVIRWLRESPVPGLTVLAIQVIALATALIPVRLLGW